ncbi:MAG TPA: endonuclease III [Nitrospiraceae bacterium]|jgi:endonuclease-3|nr:endonuclease III [Nitrospiraceae bacterium]
MTRLTPQTVATETPKERRLRVRKIVRILDRTYPDSKLALNFTTPLELLIALILAAQCTDERVNQVTATLFPKYRRAEEWARIPRATLEAEIRSTGFYRNKAKAIQECCAALVERFQGAVPDRLEDLVSLPGVGRKTANIVLGNAFGRPAIGVDTHVGRLAQRLGLTKETNPDKIEGDLNPIVPDPLKVRFCHLLQAHGRAVCLARKPDCAACPLNRLCPFPVQSSKIRSARRK